MADHLGTSMTAYHQDERVTVWQGDCLNILPTLPDNSVDAVVTDPPAGISFMGRDWDHHKGGRDQWIAWLRSVMTEALRVAKPGAHALVWALPRTSHWTATAIEDAGWVIRDRVVHLFGTGFPKSHNLPGGFGTALKPGAEDWWLVRKPLSEGTVAANVLAWGTGALTIDAARIAGAPRPLRGDHARTENTAEQGRVGWEHLGSGKAQGERANAAGRWPANVVLDEHAAQELDQQSGELTSGANPTRRSSDKFRDAYGEFKGQEECAPARGADSGGASRFFYTSKASTDERITHNGTAHPTVKPLDLMRWLVRLVCPPGGVILEPFAGSGTTVEAALLEGFRCIAIEREPDYLPLITQRINRRRDPIAYITAAGEDLGLFGDDVA